MYRDFLQVGSPQSDQTTNIDRISKTYKATREQTKVAIQKGRGRSQLLRDLERRVNPEPSV